MNKKTGVKHKKMERKIIKKVDVEKSIHKKLTIIKSEMEFKNYSDTISYLLEKASKVV